MKLLNKKQLFNKDGAWYYKMNSFEEAKVILKILDGFGFKWINGKNASYLDIRKFGYPWYLEYSSNTLSLSRTGNLAFTKSSHIYLNF